MAGPPNYYYDGRAISIDQGWPRVSHSHSHSAGERKCLVSRTHSGDVEGMGFSLVFVGAGVVESEGSISGPRTQGPVVEGSSRDHTAGRDSTGYSVNPWARCRPHSCLSKKIWGWHRGIPPKPNDPNLPLTGLKSLPSRPLISTAAWHSVLPPLAVGPRFGARGSRDHQDPWRVETRETY